MVAPDPGRGWTPVATEALTTVRRLVRTRDSAPAPLQQTKVALAALRWAGPWDARGEGPRLDLADRLATRPPLR